MSEAAAATAPRTALLGLGLMGSAMARNLLASGWPVAVWNRTASRAQPFAEQGARVAATPRDAVRDAELVVAALGDDAASRAVWLGDDGALVGLESAALAIETSTISPTWVRELAAGASARGAGFVDAPFTGSRRQSEARELFFFVGGAPEDVARAAPFFAALGRGSAHLGPVGSGATMKLVNNLMGGVQIAALSEALHLAEAAGMDVAAVAEVIKNGSPGSPFVRSVADRIVRRDYEPHFALKWAVKDLSYAIDEAGRHAVPVPMVAAARELYIAALDLGFAERDFSCVAEVLRRRSLK